MTRVYYSAMRKKAAPMERQRTRESGVAVYGYLVLLLSVAILLIAYIWEYHRILDLSEHVRNAKVEVRKLTEANHALSVEIAALSSRTRIERVAQQTLKLNHPNPQYVFWHENPGDRFKIFNTDDSILARADKWMHQMLTIGTVEAKQTH